MLRKKGLKNILFIAIGVILISSLFMVCDKSSSSLASTTKKVVDLAGRTVEIPKTVNRIVCSGPGALRLICYMNEEGEVVGVEQAEKKWGPTGRPYMLANPELANLPPIGPGGPGAISSGPDAELVVKLRPDVIFVTYMEKGKADDYQKKVHIPVIVLSYGKLATFKSEAIFNSLRVIGEVLNNEKRAKEVVAFMQKLNLDLENRTKDILKDKKPTVYVGGLGHKGMHGVQSTSCKYPPFIAVSANNVTDKLRKDGQLFIDKEQLIKWNPDYIFIDEGGYQLVMKDLQLPSMKLLKAVKNSELYGILPYNFYTTNICTAFADAYYIGKVLCPDRFKDIDPERKADEIYTFLVGKSVYKEMQRDFGGFKKIEYAGSK